MYDFMNYVLYELKSSLLLVALAGLLAGVVLAAAVLHHRRRWKGTRRFPWGRVMGWLLLAGYLAVVFCVTILRRTDGWREISLHPLRAWREAWNDFSFKSWANVLLNIAMFGPLGFLLPLLWKRMRKWYLAIPTGFGVSACIELIQLALARGSCDADDLLANTLGAALGWLAAMAVLALRQEKGKRAKPFLRWASLAGALLLAIAAPFPVYALREYGNLPEAPAYRVDTRNSQWQLDCALPEMGSAADTYRTQTLTRADCLAVAREIAGLAGGQVIHESYYQEGAYYNLMDPSGYLWVYYHDGSWEYFVGWPSDEEPWQDTDRQTLEEALAAFPVEVPDHAEFTAEGEGWYSFNCRMHRDGDTLVDGTLRVRYSDGAGVMEIENHLIRYHFYEQAAVLTPEGAYERLQAGHFNDEGCFEHIQPEAVSVTECIFGYAVDTKGFYQPVYRFHLSSPQGDYACTVMIPAMK